ncbi:MAG: hypothetical protein H0X30_15070 [Anaerolineae bacterium]|nr:hypothetical protein [Anaerolineae bacterium]
MSYILENGLMKIGNTYYEVALDATHGGIAYILDKSSNKNIVEGDASSNLWSATLDKGDPIVSSSYSEIKPVWDAANGTLTLSYTGAVSVQVTITSSDTPALKLQATVMNKSGANISNFELPDSLKIAEADVDNALIPMMPGAQLSSKFFTDGRTYVNEYPGVMFADYLAVNSKRGRITVYTQKGALLQPSLLGFEHLKDDAGFSKMTHSYRTWIEDTKTWLSPYLVINIGQDYPTTIHNYRSDNQIDKFKSLTEKLGEAAPTYFASPMYKLDIAVLKVKFADISDAIINKLNIPGMIHFVAFQTGGHDHNYPDFIPPDKKWGTTADFAEAVKLIHSRGGLVVPYTNFSWWNNHGPMLAKLPADTPLTSIINIKDSHGLPGFESFGPNSGFVMNIHNKFVQDKITEQHKALLNDVGVDAIFEDQWGARSAPYDFNPSGLDTDDPSTSYFEGVLGHYRDQSNSNLMTEVGVDVLANDGVGFMGTNYLWDMLGYRSATADVTTYYPMAAMLLRDKVLLYQHDLAAEMWTKNKDMLRWNLAQGYGLSNAFLDSSISGLNMDNPWLNLVGVFQKYALSNYADQLATAYDDLGNNVTRTTFSTYTVYSNWDLTHTYTLNGNTLSAGGVVAQANDGSVTAGVFTVFNGSPLSDGDHYLVEVRSPTEIKVFQPVGADMNIHIHKDASWSKVTVTAYGYDGTSLGAVTADVTDDSVKFNYTNTINGRLVGYYQIAPAT